MESGRMMLLHAVIIGAVLYAILRFVMKTPANVAENRSLLVAGLVLVYMVLFGHGLPTSINKAL